MNRDTLIKKLTDRKMATAEKSKTICGCVGRIICINSPRVKPTVQKK